jgi:hypothetical protein
MDEWMNSGDRKGKKMGQGQESWREGGEGEEDRQTDRQRLRISIRDSRCLAVFLPYSRNQKVGVDININKKGKKKEDSCGGQWKMTRHLVGVA